jgi:hypothetical protein
MAKALVGSHSHTKTLAAYDIVWESRQGATNDRHQSLFDSRSRRTTIQAVHSEEEPSMCDYSLHHVASRPAKVGDKLVTTKFVNTPTGGFAAVDNPNVAVCLRPGTELAFEHDVECEPMLGILPSRKIGQRLARFRQINVEQPCVHHDALEFPDGKIVLVTRLREGQQAAVLQMPAAIRGERVAAPAAASGDDERVPETALERLLSR